MSTEGVQRAKVRLSNTRSPQTYEVLERLPSQPGDLPEESYFRVKNDKTGEELTVVLTRLTQEQLGDSTVAL